MYLLPRCTISPSLPAEGDGYSVGWFAHFRATTQALSAGRRPHAGGAGRTGRLQCYLHQHARARGASTQQSHGRAAVPGAQADADRAREGLATRRELGPLHYDEAAELLDKQFGALTGEAADLAQRLLRRAGGVPFFLISLAQGVTTGAQDASTDQHIPADVEESVLQRLVLLPTTARDLLGVAAALGRRVHGDLLAVASDLAEDDRIISLEALCQARLLIEESDDAYHFAHDLIREVVEAKLSTARRRMLHRRVGEALEQKPSAPVEQLAYHYLHSDRLDKALTYGLLAAEQAKTRHAHAEAEEYYRSAVTLARKLGDRLREATALERLGLMLDGTANMAQSREALEQVIQACQVAEDQEGLRRSLARLMRVYRASGIPPEVGLARLEAFLPSLLDGEASAGRAMLHVALARLYSVAGRFNDELAEAEQAKEIANALGEAALEAEAEHWRSNALMDLERPEESLRVAESALPLAVRGGDLWWECFLLGSVTLAHLRMGTMWQCEEATTRAVELGLGMGMPGPLTTALCNRSDVAFHRGEHQASLLLRGQRRRGTSEDTDLVKFRQKAHEPPATLQVLPLLRTRLLRQVAFQCSEHRSEGLLATAAMAAAVQHLPALRLRADGCLAQQSRLANARLAGEDQQRGTTTRQMSLDQR
jgi:tetratricopeptide (TPR) repeat protein